jgi:hypothetical protein
MIDSKAFWLVEHFKKRQFTMYDQFTHRNREAHMRERGAKGTRGGSSFPAKARPFTIGGRLKIMFTPFGGAQSEAVLLSDSPSTESAGNKKLVKASTRTLDCLQICTPWCWRSSMAPGQLERLGSASSMSVAWSAWPPSVGKNAWP